MVPERLALGLEHPLPSPLPEGRGGRTARDREHGAHCRA
ncbi:hypothetical protein PCLA_06f0380 [Pseudomonas citronellolis]|nr:hypothetical protein PCLA_06f0380 [Pseudomonas citronellolis]